MTRATAPDFDLAAVDSTRPKSDPPVLNEILLRWDAGVYTSNQVDLRRKDGPKQLEQTSAAMLVPFAVFVSSLLMVMCFRDYVDVDQRSVDAGSDPFAFGEKSNLSG